MRSRQSSVSSVGVPSGINRPLRNPVLGCMTMAFFPSSMASGFWGWSKSTKGNSQTNPSARFAFRHQNNSETAKFFFRPTPFSFRQVVLHFAPLEVGRHHIDQLQILRDTPPCAMRRSSSCPLMGQLWPSGATLFFFPLARSMSLYGPEIGETCQTN